MVDLLTLLVTDVMCVCEHYVHFSVYCVVVLYQSLSVGENRQKNGDGNQLALIFFFLVGVL